MAQGRLGRGNGHLFGRRPEDDFHRPGLGQVAQFRGGAVGVDVAHLFRIDAGFLDGLGHGGGGAGAVFIGRGDVAGVAGGAHPYEFGIDARPAGSGALIFLQHDHARPFRHDKPVAVLFKRARGLRRLVIPRG